MALNVQKNLNVKPTSGGKQSSVYLSFLNSLPTSSLARATCKSDRLQSAHQSRLNKLELIPRLGIQVVLQFENTQTLIYGV